MLVLKNVTMVLIVLYTIPALLMFVFSGTAYRDSNSLERNLLTFLIFSPQILLFIAFMVPKFLPDFDNTKFIVFIPFIVILLFTCFSLSYKLKNRAFNKSEVEKNKSASQRFLDLLPKEDIDEKPEFYLVRNIVETQEKQVFMVALQYPLSKVVDGFGNRDILDSGAEGKEPGVKMWLYMSKKGEDSTIYRSGYIKGAYVSAFSFSNTGMYKPKAGEIESKNFQLVLSKGGVEAKNFSVYVDKLPMLEGAYEVNFEQLKDYFED